MTCNAEGACTIPPLYVDCSGPDQHSCKVPPVTIEPAEPTIYEPGFVG